MVNLNSINANEFTYGKKKTRRRRNDINTYVRCCRFRGNENLNIPTLPKHTHTHTRYREEEKVSVKGFYLYRA